MKKFFIVMVFLCVLSLLPLSGFVISRSYRAPRGIDPEEGVSMLEDLEDVDLNEIQKKLDVIEQQRLEALARAKRALKTQDLNRSPWSQYIQAHAKVER